MILGGPHVFFCFLVYKPIEWWIFPPFFFSLVALLSTVANWGTNLQEFMGKSQVDESYLEIVDDVPMKNDVFSRVISLPYGGSYDIL